MASAAASLIAVTCALDTLETVAVLAALLAFVGLGAAAATFLAAGAATT